MPRVRPPPPEKTLHPVVPPRNFRKKHEKELTIWDAIYGEIQAKSDYDITLLYEITNLCHKNGYFILPRTLYHMKIFVEVGYSYYCTSRFPLALSILEKAVQSFPLPTPKDGEPTFLNMESFTEDYVRLRYVDCLKLMKKFDLAEKQLKLINSPEYEIERSESQLEIDHLTKMDPDGKLQSMTRYDPWNVTRMSRRQHQLSIGPVIFALKTRNTADIKAMDLPTAFLERFIDTTGPEKADITLYLSAWEKIGRSDYKGAYALLDKMSHANCRLLTDMAYCSYKLDHRDRARQLLFKAHRQNEIWIDGMDLLGYLCVNVENLGRFAAYDTGNMSNGEPKFGAEMQYIAQCLLRDWPDRAETYLVSGFLAKCEKKDAKTSIFGIETTVALADMAISLATPGSDQHMFALILKAVVKTDGFQAVSPHQEECIQLLREGLQMVPNHVEATIALVDLYLECNDFSRSREAKIKATALSHALPESLHAKLLKIHVFLNCDRRNRESGGAVTADLLKMMADVTTEYPHVINTMNFLLTELARSGNTERVEEFLEKMEMNRRFVPLKKVPVYHRMMADYSLKLGHPVKAYEHMVAALSMGVPMDAFSYKMHDYEKKFRDRELADLDEQLEAILNSPSSEEGTVVAVSPTTSKRTMVKKKKGVDTPTTSIHTPQTDAMEIGGEIAAPPPIPRRGTRTRRPSDEQGGDPSALARNLFS